MNENISTEELAAALRIQPQTIRAGLCRNKGKHYMGLKPIKLPNRRLVRESEALKAVPHFGMHDGRRSFLTWAHENLEHPDVVEACLGHTIKGVREIYARPQLESARRRLMQAWQNHLDGASALAARMSVG